jgi:hypothetical protein
VSTGVEVADEYDFKSCFNGRPRLEASKRICVESEAYRAALRPRAAPPWEALLQHVYGRVQFWRKRLQGKRYMEMLQDFATGGAGVFFVLLLMRALVPAGHQRGARTQSRGGLLEQQERGEDGGSDDDLDDDFEDEEEDTAHTGAGEAQGGGGALTGLSGKGGGERGATLKPLKQVGEVGGAASDAVREAAKYAAEIRRRGAAPR